jgi:hypothetical protein
MRHCLQVDRPGCGVDSKVFRRNGGAVLAPNCILCGQTIGDGCTCSRYVDVTRVGVLDPDTGRYNVQGWEEARQGPAVRHPDT